MLSVPLLSQQDDRWKDKPLGTSPSLKIGGYGCIVACLTMLSGRKDVGEVNDLMVQNEAFVQDSLTNWVKVPQALPKLKFVYRYWYYDNTIVKQYIYDKKTPVIVQVDAGPIGAPRLDHYVLYLGDQKLADPGTGRIRSTSDFPNPKGFILYDILSEPLDTLQSILYSDKSDQEKVQLLQGLYPKQ